MSNRLTQGQKQWRFLVLTETASHTFTVSERVGEIESSIEFFDSLEDAQKFIHNYTWKKLADELDI